MRMHYFYLFPAQLMIPNLGISTFFLKENNSETIADQQTGDLEVLYFMK